MVIRGEQLRAVAESMLFRKLHGFLIERARLPGVRIALLRRKDAYLLWSRIARQFNTGSEYRTAIVLSYAFVRQSLGFDAELDTARLLSESDPEFSAKTYFEDAHVFRFSEFDMSRDVD